MSQRITFRKIVVQLLWLLLLVALTMIVDKFHLTRLLIIAVIGVGTLDIAYFMSPKFRFGTRGQ